VKQENDNIEEEERQKVLLQNVKEILESEQKENITVADNLIQIFVQGIQQCKCLQVKKGVRILIFLRTQFPGFNLFVTFNGKVIDENSLFNWMHHSQIFYLNRQ
jgi:hypothetical protein